MRSSCGDLEMGSLSYLSMKNMNKDTTSRDLQPATPKLDNYLPMPYILQTAVVKQTGNTGNLRVVAAGTCIESNQEQSFGYIVSPTETVLIELQYFKGFHIHMRLIPCPSPYLFFSPITSGLQHCLFDPGIH